MAWKDIGSAEEVMGGTVTTRPRKLRDAGPAEDFFPPAYDFGQPPAPYRPYSPIERYHLANPQAPGATQRRFLSKRRQAEMGIIEADPATQSEKDGGYFDLPYDAIQRLVADDEQKSRVSQQKQFVQDNFNYPTAFVGPYQAAINFGNLGVRAFDAVTGGSTADEINRNMSSMEIAADQLAGGSKIKQIARNVTGSTMGMIIPGGLAGKAAAGVGAGAKAIAAASTAASIGSAGLTTANSSFTEAKDAGKSTGEALKYAAIQGAIESGVNGIFQLVGLGGAEKALFGGTAAKSFRDLAGKYFKGLAQELPEEWITTAAQDLNNSLSGVNPVALKNKDGSLWNKDGPSPFVNSMLDTMYQTAATMGLINTPRAIGLSKEAAQNWMARNPDSAKAIAAIETEKPTRGELEKAGLAGVSGLDENGKVLTTPEIRAQLRDNVRAALAEVEAAPVEPGLPTAEVVPEPMVVTGYRGSNGKGTGLGGNGRFFSPDRKVAEAYAGKTGKVIEEALTFNKPLVSKNWFEAKRKLGLATSANMETLITTARDAGHDGIVFENMNGKPEYVDLGTTEQAMAAAPAPQQSEVRLGPKSYPIPASMEDAVGSDVAESKGAADILADMSRDYDVPIRKGRIKNKKAIAIFKTVPDVVRMTNQASTDVAAATHEVAHHLDETTDLLKSLPKTHAARMEVAKLDYDKTANRDFEGLAEFMRHYWTYGPQDAQAKAPKFFAHFQAWLGRNPAMAAKVNKTLGQITTWRNMGAERRIEGQISRADKPTPSPEPLGVRVSNWLNQFYTNWKSAGQSLSRVDKLAKSKGYKFTPDEASSYELYGAYDQAAPAAASRAMEDGVRLFSNGQKVAPGLKQVLAEGGIVDSELDRFSRYLVARQAAEVYAKTPERNPGVAKADVEAFMAAMQQDPATAARFEQAAQGVTAFANGTVDLLVDAGVISPESAQKMKDQWQQYTPLMRVGQKGSGMGGGKGGYVDLGEAVGRRKGSGDAIIDPLESLARMTAYRYDRAMKQMVVRQLARETDQKFGGVRGMGKLIERVDPKTKISQVFPREVWPAIVAELERLGLDIDMDTVDGQGFKDLGDQFTSDLINIYRDDMSSDPKNHIVRVNIDGETVLYQLHPDLYKALKSMSPAQSGVFVSLLAGANSAMKAGAVGYNTFFTGMNAFRDWTTFQLQSKKSRNLESLYTPFVWTSRYIASLSGANNDVIDLWKEMDGSLATRMGFDKTATVRGRRGLAKPTVSGTIDYIRKHPVGSSKAVVGQVLDKTRDLLGFAEAGPRLAEFYGALRESGYEVRGNKLVNAQTGKQERPPQNVLVKAINAANDVTTNFKRMGTKGRTANKIVPFLNAALEGADKTIRTLGEAARGENPRALIGLSALASASILYYLTRSDDDDYEAQDDWLRYNYWTFTDDEGNPVARVPKPQGLFGTAVNTVETIMRAWDKGNVEPLKELASAEAERNIPGSMPSLATPLAESYFNWDFFRQAPIENESMTGLLPQDRAQPYTSEAMKSLAQMVSPVVQVSPAKLEHIANSTTGGAYGRLSGAAGRASDGELGARDIPFVGGFVVRKDYPADVNDFYQERELARQTAGSEKLNGEPGDAAEHHYRLEKIHELMSDLRAPIKDVTDRDKRFAYEKFIVGLSREALGREPLPRYPSPLSSANVSAEASKIRDEWLGGLAYTATQSPPVRERGEADDHFAGRQKEHEQQAGRSARLLSAVKMPKEKWEKLLADEAERRGYSTRRIKSGKPTAYLERVRALQTLTQGP